MGRSELIQHLRELAEEFGRPPTTREMKEHGKHSATVYFRRFDSWNDAIRAAGYTPVASAPDVSEQRIPATELLAEIHRLAEQVGGRPTTEQMNEHGQYSVRPYVNRFGSWVEALRAAGFEPTTHQLRRYDPDSDETQ